MRNDKSLHFLLGMQSDVMGGRSANLLCTDFISKGNRILFVATLIAFNNLFLPIHEY